MSMYQGVDISAIQGNVDMEWLKNKGYSFTVSRCYVGNDYKDAMCDTNLAKAKNAGLYTTIYNFVYPLPTNPQHPNRDPLSQANLHFNACQGQPVGVDLEWPPPEDWTKYGCSASQISDWILTYLEKYTQLSGSKPILYTYPYFAKAVNLPSDITQYALWIASYTPTPTIPSPWSDYYMWQTGGGNLLTLPNGVKCDTDVVKDLSLWGVNPEPQSVVTAVPEITTQPPAPVEVAPAAVAQAASPATSSSSDVVSTIVKALETASPIVLQVIKTLLHIK